MVGNVITYTTIGIDAQQISVECDATGGHKLLMIGHPGKEIVD